VLCGVFFTVTDRCTVTDVLYRVVLTPDSDGEGERVCGRREFSFYEAGRYARAYGYGMVPYVV
jgi:hypothetical protein